jgi:hypothetical protein
LAGSLLNTAVTVFGAPVLQARRNARKVPDTYREPPLAAAFELQARLHNILHRRSVEDYVIGNRSERTDAAVESTLYVFGQFFAWREIIRREIQLLNFGETTTRGRFPGSSGTSARRFWTIRSTLHS